MKKFLFLLLFIPGLVKAQQGSVNATAIHSQVVDSTTVAKPLHYGSTWYTKQVEKWRITENGVDYDLIPKFVKSPSIGYLNWDGTRFKYSSVSSGITNSAAANELMKSNGTNAVPSGIFSTTVGSVILGSASIAGDRTLSTVGSGTNSSLTINSQGAGSGINFQVNSSAFFSLNILNYDAITNRRAISVNSSAILYVSGYTNATIPGGIRSFSGIPLLITTEATSGVISSGKLWLKTGDAYASGNASSGDIILNTGTKNGSGTQGNISLFDDTGSFGSGQQVAFVHDAMVNPSTNPTAGFILYSDAGNSSHPTVRLSSGSTYDLTAGVAAGSTNDVQKNGGSGVFASTGISSTSSGALSNLGSLTGVSGTRLLITNGTDGIRLNATSSDILIDNNTSFFGTSSYGGGSFVMFIANRSVAPSTNPTGGGILYAEGGALKWRGSLGTVTTIANP